RGFYGQIYPLKSFRARSFPSFSSRVVPVRVGAGRRKVKGNRKNFAVEFPFHSFERRLIGACGPAGKAAGNKARWSGFFVSFWHSVVFRLLNSKDMVIH